MKTIGINTEQQIIDFKNSKGGFLKLSDDEGKEISLKEMINSCFTYGGYKKESYNFEKYILPYKNKMDDKLFEEIYNEQVKFLEEKCKVISDVFTDGEGCTYNSLVLK